MGKDETVSDYIPVVIVPLPPVQSKGLSSIGKDYDNEERVKENVEEPSEEEKRESEHQNRSTAAVPWGFANM
ncbi:unnamed protein product [Caretta caretta]